MPSPRIWPHERIEWQRRAGSEQSRETLPAHSALHRHRGEALQGAISVTGQNGLGSVSNLVAQVNRRGLFG